MTATLETRALLPLRYAGNFTGVAQNLDGSPVTACSWCRQNGRSESWRVDGEWTTTRPIGLVMNHGLYPECAEIETKKITTIFKARSPGP
jgi:hypothetical protein